MKIKLLTISLVALFATTSFAQIIGGQMDGSVAIDGVNSHSFSFVDLDIFNLNANEINLTSSSVKFANLPTSATADFTLGIKNGELVKIGSPQTGKRPDNSWLIIYAGKKGTKQAIVDGFNLLQAIGNFQANQSDYKEILAICRRSFTSCGGV